jgi:hypothetical protein
MFEHDDSDEKGAASLWEQAPEGTKKSRRCFACEGRRWGSAERTYTPAKPVWLGRCAEARENRTSLRCRPSPRRPKHREIATAFAARTPPAPGRRQLDGVHAQGTAESGALESRRPHRTVSVGPGFEEMTNDEILAVQRGRAAFLADVDRVVRVIAERHRAQGAPLTWQPSGISATRRSRISGLPPGGPLNTLSNWRQRLCSRRLTDGSPSPISRI